MQLEAKLIRSVGVCLLIVFAVSGVAKADLASFARPSIPNEQVVGSEHFVVHYSGDPASANESLSTLEAMRSFFVNELRMPSPPADELDPSRDRRYDVYLLPPESSADKSFTAPSTGVASITFGGEQVVSHGEGTESTIQITDRDRQTRLTGVLAHEYFHAMQLTLDVDELGEGLWTESSAEWAASQFTGQPSAFSQPNLYSRAGMFCKPATASDDCARNKYIWSGYLTYLSSHDGRPIVNEVWTRKAELGRGNREDHTQQAIESVLSRYGTDLSRSFVDWALEPTTFFTGTGTDARLQARPSSTITNGSWTQAGWSVGSAELPVFPNPSSSQQLSGVLLSAVGSESIALVLPNRVVRPTATGNGSYRIDQADLFNAPSGQMPLLVFPNASDNENTVTITPEYKQLPPTKKAPVIKVGVSQVKLRRDKKIRLIGTCAPAGTTLIVRVINASQTGKRPESASVHCKTGRWAKLLSGHTARRAKKKVVRRVSIVAANPRANPPAQQCFFKITLPKHSPKHRRQPYRCVVR